MSAVKRKYMFLIYIALFLLCGVISWLLDESFLETHLITVYYCFMIIIWAESVRNRIVDKSVNRLLFVISIFLLSLINLRLISNTYFNRSEFLRRHMWYAYLIPITLVPLLSFFAALESSIPLSSYRKRSKLWNLLYIPCAVLWILFLTNDSHRLVYDFPLGIDKWEEGYTNGRLYFLILLWVSALIIAMLFVLIMSSQRGRTIRLLWIPILPLIVGDIIIYFYFHINRPLTIALDHIPYDLPEIFAFMIIGVWEGCIYIGLVNSNENYADVFVQADIAAEITDNTGKIIYKTTQYDPIPTAILKSVEKEPIMWDKNTRLRVEKINGGYIGWREDITNLNILRDKIDELHEQLKDESILIESENALRERRKRAEEQGKIYQMVSSSVMKQVSELDAFLDSIDVKSETFKSDIARAGFLQAYIKRRCNLALLSSNTAYLPVFELQNSLRESVELLSMNDISCELICDMSGSIKSNVALLAYDLFEDVTEALFPSLFAMLVNISLTDGLLNLKISADVSDYDKEKLSEHLSDKYNSVSVENDGASLFIKASFEGGVGI